MNPSTLKERASLVVVGWLADSRPDPEVLEYRIAEALAQVRAEALEEAASTADLVLNGFSSANSEFQSEAGRKIRALKEK